MKGSCHTCSASCRCRAIRGLLRTGESSKSPARRNYSATEMSVIIGPTKSVSACQPEGMERQRKFCISVILTTCRKHYPTCTADRIARVVLPHANFFQENNRRSEAVWPVSSSSVNCSVGNSYHRAICIYSQKEPRRLPHRPVPVPVSLSPIFSLAMSASTTTI